jgi:pimeloyl-ACP methyl ester carboxylesterase
MLTLLATLLIGGLILVSAMVAGVWWQQERITYQPPAYPPLPPSDASKIEYFASDRQRLFAYVLEPNVEASGVLLAFHGNADLATWQIPWGVEVARRTGWRVVLAEYRGYGGLDGAPTYLGIRDDARAAWRVARGLAQERRNGHDTPALALFGHSLGSGIATELASEIEADTTTGVTLTAIVLQSPFTSARDMARIVSTRPVQLLWKLIARVHYDLRAQFRDITSPIWVAHGTRDWVVPVRMGRELFARARTPGRLLIVDGAGHNDLANRAGEQYWLWLSEALPARVVRPIITEIDSSHGKAAWNSDPP